MGQKARLWWVKIQCRLTAGSFQKSDERILGDGDFVENVLAQAEEKMSRRSAYKAKGVSLDDLQQVVSTLVGIAPEQLVGSSKARNVVRARTLFSYWAVREMGFSGSEISRRLQISFPTVSIAAQKGEKIVREEGLDIGTLLNVNI